MKKGIIFLASLLLASEFQFGSGTFYLKGGFSGLDEEKSTDIKSYSLVENYKKISSFYLHYEITWYSSKTLTSAQKTIQTYTNLIPTTTTIPAIDYEYKGLDVNFVLGKDINNLGIGILLGLSIPYIDTKSSSNTSSTILKKSKTKIKTFKIGPSLNGFYQFNQYISAFVNFAYAYQTGKVKNDYLDIDTSIDGSFTQADFNFRFTPFQTKTKIGFLTLNPKLYFTAGYKYNYWIVKDVSIDISGNNIPIPKSDLEFKTSIVYLGIGYSF